jgi:hypothetical protein
LYYGSCNHSKVSGYSYGKKLSDALYLASIYDRPVTEEFSWRIQRVKLWEHGHSFAEIDNMSLEDTGDIIGYWSEKSRIEAKQRNTRKHLNKKRK